MAKIKRLYGEMNTHALDVLLLNFDVADVTASESDESIAYTQRRIDVARESIKAIKDPKERRTYDDWLYYFQSRIDEAIKAKHQH